MEHPTQYACHHSTPLGEVLLSSDGVALTGLWFEGQKYFAHGLDAWQEGFDLPLFREVRLWLDRYFAGNVPASVPPLKLQGTSFQQLVWSVLQEIPYGSVMTYGQVAETAAKHRGGRRTSARAVGAAVGRNPVSVIVPCHRVVGASGQLTGYAGGLERKAALLRLEGVQMLGDAPR